MKLFLLLLLVVLAGAMPEPAGKVSPTAIVGFWQPANKLGVLRIYEENGLFYGVVVGPISPQYLDAQNPDATLRTRDLLGTIILKSFRFDGKNAWRGGTVYDPENGKTYKCILRLRNANTLVVRGYIGISLVGRTVIWTRLP
ncbi:DUF2147 domain-containing protein [Hymenobacter sp. DG25A]|uniref:DUF2147 domain-containing protein n=1 Tax=Hymenobacter sp. DG25A TaxID=1385663 RepID=UPI0006BD9E24|nr:DUF2147 domain-containing protein [Hymenobacter sp. DG25A]ALD19919.1 hypothetical protein AM218_00050 [Hymenobacter sp. DG25A]